VTPHSYSCFVIAVWTARRIRRGRISAKLEHQRGCGTVKTCRCSVKDLADSSFGSLLRALRTSQQLSQEELAERAKMSAAAISALERGSRRAPYRSSVDLLADGLGIDQEARGQLHGLAEQRRKARALPIKGGSPLLTGGGAPSASNNLPSQISTFIGRQKELDDLSILIAKSRLLTIVGPGGIGKTRLTLQLGQNLLERYGDGVWLVDLTAVHNPDFVAQTIATALNLREVPNEPIEKTVVAGLSGKKILLIIDNAEHLLGGVAKLAKAILLRCPTVALAVTSREPLHVSGEQIYRLGSLSEAPAAADVAALSHHDSTRLFLERARDANPSMNIGDGECADVIFLCKKLEGIPLAIELACARLSSMTLKQLLSRLKSSLALASKDSTETSRHRTLRDTIAWSYELLSSGEQSALMALSVFQGSSTGDAIRAVAVAVEDLDDVVDSLVDKSLLQLDESDDEERWRLLDVVSEYASEKLKEVGGSETAARNHAAYYAGVVAAARGHDAITTYARLDSDASNIRGAIGWSIAQGAPQAMRLVLDLAPYWRVRGAVTEARAWIAKALESVASDDEARALLLCLAASFATIQDELRKSLRLSQEALSIYKRSGNSSGAAEALFRIAEAAHRQGHLDGAETGYRNALEGFTASRDARGEMLCIGNLGILARQRGELQQASTLLDDAIRRAIDLHEQRIAGEFTTAMGWVELGLNDLVASRQLFERVFAEKNRVLDPVGVCSARHGLATVALKENRLNEAAQEFYATLELARELQLKHYVARALHGLAAIQATNGNAEMAARFLGLADRLFDESGRKLRDSIAYDIAAQSIAAVVPEPRRSALLDEGATMQISEALTALRANNVKVEAT
jgi:predicted ATPase/transcriptional regulator with XRE-family HTH domain